MIRFPLYSFAFIFIAIVIGALTGNEKLGWTLAGIGSVAGYVVWIRARLNAIRHGDAFHIGSALNVFLCTVFAVGVGIVGFSSNYGVIGFFSGRDDEPGRFWAVVLAAAAGAIWLHWDTARSAHTIRLLPTGAEVGRELFEIATADEINMVSGAVAVVEVGRDLARGLKAADRRVTFDDQKPNTLSEAKPMAVPKARPRRTSKPKQPVGAARPRRARTKTK